MTVAFMGLTGPLGVLPRHYTDLLLERGRRKDWTLRDFLDIFNHRLISLFYRAWEKYRLPIVYEAAAWRHQENDCGSQYLFDLMGLGTSGLRGAWKSRTRGCCFILAPGATSALGQCVSGVLARLLWGAGRCGAVYGAMALSGSREPLPSRAR